MFAADSGVLFDSHPLPMWVYDVETLRFLAVNQAAIRQYGYSGEEFLRLTINDIRPPEAVSAPLEAAGPSPARHRRKDGTLLDVEAVAQAVDWGGRPARLVVITDVSARKNVERSLLAHEEKYRAVLATMEDGYYEVDLAGKLTFANEALAQLLGYARAELIGMRHRAYTDRDNARRAYDGFRRVFDTGLPVRAYDWEIVRKDGGRRAVEASVQLAADAAGRPVGFRGIVRDVTRRRRVEQALRRSEAHFRSLVDNAPFGIYRATVEGAFVAVNPALVAMLGYASADELMAVDVATAVYCDATERAHLIRTYEETHDLRNIEVCWKRKDGTQIWVRLNGRGVTDAAGVLGGFEVIVEDVTERRALEDQLRLTQRLEAVGRLAGGIAHDFGNLITAITGYSDLLLRAMTPEDPWRADVEEIRATSLRAADLTRQLLAYSRRQVLAPQVLDLHEVVADMSSLLHRVLGEDAELDIVSRPGTGIVMADRGQLEQVLMNLTVNARDAMPRGGRFTIEVTAVTLDEAYGRLHANAPPGPYVLLSLSDTGTGMDAETRAHLFEPFFTTKPRGKGTGLGLATIYGIVKQSGGFVWVYSEPGEGTTFKIYLPAVTSGAAPVARAEASPRPASGVLRGTETILLAEDEPAVRTAVRRFLEAAGYRVLEACDGLDALAVAANHPDTEIHVLVTDIVMPGLKGHELAARFRDLRPRARVVFTSGHTNQAIAGALPPGAPFLAKPFTPEALARKVREVLDS